MDSNATASGGGPGDGPSSRSRLRMPRSLRRLGMRRTLILLLSIFALGWLLWARCGVRGCPPVERLVAYQPGGAPVLLDAEGHAFARLAPVERRVVSLDSLPAHVAAAFLTVEDRRFFEHNGIDWIRVGGAALANLRAGRTVQGSSTITMQLARNVFAERIPARQRTWRRKILEARVARRIEDRFTKAEILELYLNHIYFGNGAYGIEAAARHYFGRPASRLTLEQAAMLAALPKAPAHYDPRRHARRARERRNLVLTLMERAGVVDERAGERARGAPLRVSRASDARRVGAPAAPYFVQHVRALLEERFGEDLWVSPLVVRTTLLPRAQTALEEEMEAQLDRVEAGAYGRFSGERRAQHSAADGEAAYLQGAAVALDAHSGEVRALVGGRDWVHSRFNRAVAARRQVGSAFKPFVYATALTEGWSGWDWLDDSPYRRAARGSATWEPANFDGQFRGPVTVREALVLSRNVPTVRLAEAVGVGDVARVARAAGMRGEMPESPVIALGVTEASPLELAAAYGVFANAGESVQPRFITRVETPDGEVLWEPKVGRSQRVLNARVAEDLTSLLRDAVDYGTGRAVRSAGYRGPAAGKTGTTNDGADAWFVGYTPSLVAAVWVGFDRPRPIAARVSGGSVAAEIWGRAMRRIDNGRDEWSPPRVAEGRRRDDVRERTREREQRRRPDPSMRRHAESWFDGILREIERERRQLERDSDGSLRALAEELEDLMDDLPLERDARREVERFLRDLEREYERQRRERLEDDEELRELLHMLPELFDEREVRIRGGRR